MRSFDGYLETLLPRYPDLDVCREDILAAYQALYVCYIGGGKLLVAGESGNVAGGELIVGELMEGFKQSRRRSFRKGAKWLRGKLV